MMNQRLATIVCLLACLVLVGCGAEPGQAEDTSLSVIPAHPAMRSPTSGPAAPPTSRLPEGHPPVGGGAAGSPGGRAPAGGGGGRAAAEVAPAAIEGSLASLGLTVELPKGWRYEAGSSMRLGTARLPAVDGDAGDGEMSIIPAAGSIDANIARWEGQFRDDPKPTAQRRMETAAGGLDVTVVEIDGTFSGGGPMMGDRSGPKAGTKLLGAIVQLPGGSGALFFKAWGPQATMERWRGEFDSMVSSLGPAR